MAKTKSQPKTWRKVKLGEILELKYGYGLTEKNRENGNVPVFGSSGVIGKHSKAMVNSEGVIIGRKGNVGSVYYSDCPFYPIDTVYYTDSLKLKGDLKFFYYFLQRIPFQKIGSDVGVPGLNRDIAYSLDITIPEDINEQKRIAGILSAFDDKIELNNRINQTLEQMARAIFKEWFVNSEKLKVKSEKLKGWKVKNADDLFVFEKGVEPGSNSYSITKKANFIPFYRVRDLEGKNGDTDVFINKEVANNKICKYNDVLISFDATVGRIKTGCSGAFSSGIRRVYSKDGFIKNSFIYFWLKTPYVQNTILEHSSGTTILHAGSSIEFLKILFNKEIINKFQKISEPIFNKILEINKENQKLASLRDLLLPKLMSGEIRA